MIRLAIAEDHTIVRWALREALSKAEDIEVVRATLIQSDWWTKFGIVVVGEFENEAHSHRLSKAKD